MLTNPCVNVPISQCESASGRFHIAFGKALEGAFSVIVKSSETFAWIAFVSSSSASPAVYDAPPGPAHQLGRHQVPEAQPGEDQLQHVGVQRGHGGQRHGECWRCWRDRDMLETKLLTQIKTQTARQSPQCTDCTDCCVDTVPDTADSHKDLFGPARHG